MEKVYYIEKYDEIIIILEDLINMSDEFAKIFPTIDLTNGLKATYIGDI